MTYQCFHCGCSSVTWDGDHSFEDYGIEGEGIVHECHCAECVHRVRKSNECTYDYFI